MINWVEGKAISVKSTSERQEELKRLLAGLTPEEQRVLKALVADYYNGDKAGLKNLLEALEYEQKPVSLQEFLFDDYYIGQVGRRLYPKLVDDMFELFEGNYYLVVLTGSIAWGKSFFTALALARILYLLSCMRNPAASLGLAEGSIISIVNMSVTIQLAKKVVFGTLANILRESPYFNERFNYNDTQTELRFPKNIWVAPVTSHDSGVLGLNVIAGCIDESNFLDYNPQTRTKTIIGRREYTRVESTFYALLRRIKSRYLQPGGLLPGMLFVLSSERAPDDFTRRLIKEMQDDSGVFVRQYALYDVNPRFQNSRRFRVFVGNEHTGSRILDSRERVSENEDGYVITVPEEFRKDFEADINLALREIAGVPVVSTHPFITNRGKLDEMIDVARVHPFSAEVWDSERPADFLWSYLTKKEENGYRPLVNPGVVRHIHIDLGLRHDAVGFCMAHICGMKPVVRRVVTDGGAQETVENLPMIYVDFILRIEPPKFGEISISMVRGLIYRLLEHGFRIRYVSMDSWESADMLQQLRQRGINAEVVSVDRTLVPYETLKSAIYDGRLSVYKYEPLLQELRALELDVIKHKVDHPSGGRKDCADALAGCVYSLVTQQGQNDFIPPAQVFEHILKPRIPADVPVLATDKDLFREDANENEEEIGNDYPAMLFGW